MDARAGDLSNRDRRLAPSESSALGLGRDSTFRSRFRIGRSLVVRLEADATGRDRVRVGISPWNRAFDESGLGFQSADGRVLCPVFAGRLGGRGPEKVTKRDPRAFGRPSGGAKKPLRFPAELS